MIHKYIHIKSRELGPPLCFSNITLASQKPKKQQQIFTLKSPTRTSSFIRSSSTAHAATATMSKALWAPVKWAQRKDSIYVTVDLPDVKDEQVKLTNTNLTFRCVSASLSVYT